jgi:NADH dehydrogenase
MINSTVTAEYEDLAINSARLYLVERGPVLLAPFSERAHEYASKVLHRDGVIFKLNTAVNEVHPGHVVLSDGTTIKPAALSGKGSRRLPLPAALGLPKGVVGESMFSRSHSRSFGFMP